MTHHLRARPDVRGQVERDGPVVRLSQSVDTALGDVPEIGQAGSQHVLVAPSAEQNDAGSVGGVVDREPGESGDDLALKIQEDHASARLAVTVVRFQGESLLRQVREVDRARRAGVRCR